MARVPFNTTIDEKLLLRMKKKALDYKISLNDLSEACWRCFADHEMECSVRKMYKKRLEK